MNAQDLPQHRLRALRIATRLDVAWTTVVTVAAVAGRDIEIVVVARPRAKPEPATVMIRRRLIEREHDHFAVGIGDLGIGRDVETRDMGDAVSERPAGRGIVDVKPAVARVIRIEGKAEQSLLIAARLDPGMNVEEGRRIDCARREINDENLTRLLDDENPIRVARGRGQVERE